VVPPAPLTLNEKQVIYGQLYELSIVRVQLDEAKTREAQERAQYEKEKALWEERVKGEQELAQIASMRIDVKEKELVLAKDQLVFYQTAYQACKDQKKRGIGCTIKKIFTIGISKCH
jgi:hypothetical protein